MTGYHLTVGYISGYGFGGSQQEAFGRLKNLATGICNSPQSIIEEMRRGVPTLSEDHLQDYVQPFREQADATIKFLEGEIMLLASGAGFSRALKEQSRQAFCRLLIAAAHREGIEVNLVVA